MQEVYEEYVDSQILRCLDLKDPKSFFLFAGAGSGKTRSLVNVLSEVKKAFGNELRYRRQKVAIITYTNAACDEIKHRLEYDPLFAVSTIHSFVWDLIKPYQNDLKSWVKSDLAAEITSLKLENSRGRAGTKAAIDRVRKIESKQKRLDRLPQIKTFTYSPTGDNREKDALNHSEVIQIAANFLLTKPLLQTILIRRFPILLIDESQDTKHELIDAFFAVQAAKPGAFSLGLFGDMMQRIYSDGKENLGSQLPSDWLTPAKTINYRCPTRVVKLINKIRERADGQQQIPRPGKMEGSVRMFLAASEADRAIAESSVSSVMSGITNDEKWKESSMVTTLILEHHMAARRLGFLELFEALYANDRLRTGLLDGTLSGLNLFTQIVLPLVKAKQEGDWFMVAKLVREHSPLFKEEFFRSKLDQREVLQQAELAVDVLANLWTTGLPKLEDVLKVIRETGLFPIPENLKVVAMRLTSTEEILSEDPDDDLNARDAVILAWEKAMECTVAQVSAYHQYITGASNFATHQGVKGLQFPRVMVVIDDKEARGFLFSYGKLFGVKEPTEADLKNMRERKDTSSDRTRRLFYVACSRAEESLAILCYSANPAAVRAHVLSNGWFDEDEVLML